MISPAAIMELKQIVGPEHLKTPYDDLSAYATDGTKLKYPPDAVALPGTGEEISLIMLLANRERFPVIPRGGGSGMTGGALAVQGGLVLSLERFNRILMIDRENLIAKVEPGVITEHLQQEVEKLDLFYPPDPASADVSSLGGNVAECAGGLRGLKYGVTRDYILGLTVVLPTGEIIKTGVDTMKGVAGYDLTRLIVGSEGTLAVITSITLRLVPKPPAKRAMTAFFRDVRAAAKTVSNIIREKITPATLEFMDRQCIDCVRDEMDIDIPVDAGAMLLIETDGDHDVVEKEAQKLKDICLRSGAMRLNIATNKEEFDRVWEARRGVSPSLKNLRPGKVSEDVVVPRSRLVNLVSSLNDMADKYALPIASFGHAGDGNIHVNILIDPDNREEVGKAGLAVKELFEIVVALGGTITGEHGIGITKAPYMELEFPKPALDLMARLKAAFDPNGILNPGKIFLEKKAVL
ncbi:MAG: FAD-binding protein [Deltaproteobacteria bacterium]|nr:FAD-binding protein [Deltaproteobacteria bacterium]